HGVAERDGSAFLLLEDIHASANNPWENALDMTALAVELPRKTKAGACWVFMDACQELLENVIRQTDGLAGWKLVTTNVVQAANTRVRSASLAAAKFGKLATAPNDGGVAFFTDALLDALENCCVERTDGGAWATSAKEVLAGVKKVAHIWHGQVTVDPEPLSIFNDELFFLPVPDPKIPVMVTSVPEILIARSSVKVIKADSGQEVVLEEHDNGQMNSKRFRVPIDENYIVVVGDPPDTIEKPFFTKPPAVPVTIRGL
ncbi:MAG: hypothetical protein AAF633_23045, partial [Chloroflexota bacterium]